MTDRPILFSGPMVRALLDGRKTQTRRVLKPTAEAFETPKYRTGDRLWVREAWRADSQVDAVKPSDLSIGEPVYFEADGAIFSRGCMMIKAGRARPSMFMPRWASRLTLTVTEVRVQRLQDIDEKDARAEGVTELEIGTARNPCRMGYRMSFRELWDHLNDPRGYGWDANPWVAAYTFTVAHQNIDAAQAA
jgi:hypothetical protein